MKTRGVAMAVALGLAAVATATVFLYVNGVESKKDSGDDTVAVVVSNEDIPAGTDLGVLVDSGAFEVTDMPKDSVVRDAVSSLSELEGQFSSTAILAGEQVSRARFQGDETLPGGTLGIPSRHTAVTVALASPRLAGGEVQRGDHVTIYGTFRDVSGSGSESGIGVTANLVRDVEVLQVEAPDASTAVPGDGTTMVTLALKFKDAQKVVFAQEQGSVYLGLLAPGESGKRTSPLDITEVLR